MKIFERLTRTFYYNVSYPYPNRRLYGIEKARGGKIFCLHKYRQKSFQEKLDIKRNEPVRTSIRKYECEKCKRQAYVYGPCDDVSIEKAIARFYAGKKSQNKDELH